MPPVSRDRAMSSFPERPVHSNLFRRRAFVSLDILIIGAGLSGLSAAYNLKQAGHNVRILEKRDGPPKIYTGLRIPSNMSKLLQYWGLGPQLKAKAIRCPKIEFSDATSGEHLSTVVYHPELMRELEADQYGMNYKDLYDMILQITLDSGVPIEYSAEVTGIDDESTTTSVKLANGRELQADLIVGADGLNSIVREKIVGEPSNPVYGAFSNFSFLVPVSEMQKDPLLAPFLEDGTWRLWLGSNAISVNYRVSANDYFVSVFYEHDINRNQEVWAQRYPTSEIDVSQFEERIHRLMALGKDAVPSQHMLPPKIEDWYSVNGKLVLIGDSVHPDCPASTAGSALNFEDGCVLGSLFSRLHSNNRDEILRLLRAYQEIRQERCEQGIQADLDISIFLSLPPGPDRDRRNEGFKQSEANSKLEWDEGSEDSLRGAWESYRGQLAYEAYDAADDWWIDWGIMVQRLSAADNMVVEASTCASSVPYVPHFSGGVHTVSVTHEH